jgi:hypothetical protein
MVLNKREGGQKKAAPLLQKVAASVDGVSIYKGTVTENGTPSANPKFITTERTSG